MMRFVDIMYALPYIFFVIILVVIFGRSPVLLFVGIGCLEWLTMARIVRGQTLSHQGDASSSRRRGPAAPSRAPSSSATSCRTSPGRW